MAPTDEFGPPPILAPFEDLFPTSGTALEIACGRGRAAVWLALRGLEVHAVDISDVAIDLAGGLADLAGVADRCRFEIADLDVGLPDGPTVDLILCHLFRDPRLDEAVMQRLRPGGLVAIAALSEVGAEPGPFRVRRAELVEAYESMDLITAEEGEGSAFLLARSPTGRTGAARSRTHRSAVVDQDLG